MELIQRTLIQGQRERTNKVKRDKHTLEKRGRETRRKTKEDL